ncbi:MAG: exo-alpha-sialidase [Verrucomicrobia bacterium]|nr:exo-alpha-sialidase [Verrucomicrobiota bacterium]
MSHPQYYPWNEGRAVLASVFLLFVGAAALAQPAAGDGSAAGPNQVSLQHFKESLLQMSGRSGQIAAMRLGLTTATGRPLEMEGAAADLTARQFMPRNVPIAASDEEEDEPYVVANPRRPNLLVAASHKFSSVFPGLVWIAVSRSTNAGATWSAATTLPLLTPDSTAGDPSLAYAPDGRRVYCAYLDRRFSPVLDWDVVLCYSDDAGETWQGPVVALPGAGTNSPAPGSFIYDKPWIGTHAKKDQARWVYVTATRFDLTAPFDLHITFARSGARGAAGTWSDPVSLDTGDGSSVPPVVVSGARPVGGKDGNVLVAWYHADTDGWLNGGFKIRTRRSADHGASWDATVDAAVDNYELAFLLGPYGYYHRWWVGMMPDLQIDSEGQAHIVYAHSPVIQNPNGNALTTLPSGDTEQGDIRYVASARPPYRTWSAPVTVNDDGPGRAQGFAALALDGHDAVNVIWFDTRRAPTVPTAPFPPPDFIDADWDSVNRFYDIFHARKGRERRVFSPNAPVTDAPMVVNWFFLGDYIGLSANEDVLYGVWTDRRRFSSIFQFDNDVFGARLRVLDDD